MAKPSAEYAMSGLRPRTSDAAPRNPTNRKVQILSIACSAKSERDGAGAVSVGTGGWRFGASPRTHLDVTAEHARCG
eukprot:6691960-Prymnesium_polylepis.1